MKNKISGKQRMNKPMRVFYSLFLILVVLSFVFMHIGMGKRAVDYSFDDGELFEWSEEWLVRVDGEEKGTLNLPVKVEVQEGEIVSLVKNLPNREVTYDCLIIESKRQEVYVYLNGILRKAYSKSNRASMGHSLPYAYVLVPLSEWDRGDEVTIMVRADNYYAGNISRVYLGNKNSFLITLIKDNLIWVIFIGVISIVGLVSLIGYLVYRNTFDDSVLLISMFWYAFFNVGWLFTQSKIRQVFIADIPLAEGIGYCCFMLIPVPMMMIVNWITEYHHQLLFQILFVVSVIAFLTQNVLHTGFSFEYFEMQPVTQLLILGICIISIVLSIIDIRRKQVNGRITVIGSMASLMLGIIGEALFQQFAGSSNGGCFIIGSILLIVGILVYTFVMIKREQEQRKDAEAATIAKSRFLATMSHEIRTPINAVLGMNEMILRDCAEPGILEYASNISDAGKSLLSLVNDILDFSKIESGKMDIVPVEYQMKGLLSDLVLMVQGRIEKKSLKLVLEVDESIPSKYYGDEVRIRQVLTNLLTNAAKYTESGTITFTVRMAEQSNGKAKLYFSVKDTGVGIKAEDIEKLWGSSFVRVDKERNRNIEGTGLGLAITRQLLELMGSRLQVTSEHGKGSDFFFEIEQEIRDESAMGSLDGPKTEKKVKRKHSFTSPRARILAVDDTRMNLKVIGGLMRAYGAQMTLIETGSECLEVCEREHFDLIFMDHMMPGMDGIETLDKLRERNILNGAKVVALTANAISGAEQMYLDRGFDGYLTKPIDSYELDACLRENLPADVIEDIEETEEDA